MGLNSMKTLQACAPNATRSVTIKLSDQAGPSQRWVYDPATQLLKAPSQKLVLAVNGGVLDPGTKVIAAPQNDGANQKWQLVMA
jgi:hypothetical protein